jgi:hypothetical protein
VGFFFASWTRYLNNVYDAGHVQTPLSMLFFEFSYPRVNAVKLHVNDADALVTQGIRERASDNRR